MNILLVKGNETTLELLHLLKLFVVALFEKQQAIKSTTYLRYLGKVGNNIGRRGLSHQIM